MNRDQNLKQKRIQYVKKAIKSNPGPVAKTIKKLSARLFLAESTIWKDYIK